MSATRRAGGTEGCWTCKLRRKKCDERRPTCGICDNLEIACTYGPRPSWMHSGREQREMTEKLKNHVKQKAAYRRERANTSSIITHDATSHSFNIIPNMLSDHLGIHGPMDDASSGREILASGSESSPSHEPPPFPLPPEGHLQHCCLSGVESSPAIELDFTMKYLDFVFPALFPFYRPSLFETGRSWLLLLLGKSKIAYHSAVSLSCYFFTMALTDANVGEEYTECKQSRWKEVEQQTDKCFDSIKTDMSALELNLQGAPAELSQKVEVMGGVIQVLVFEMALGNCAPFNPHLSAAFALFEDIMASSCRPHQNQDQSQFLSALLETEKPSWTNPGNGYHIWSPAQAGFRFCAGLLLFIDVVASTAIQETPRLLRYHPEVLAQIDEGNPVMGEAKVQLSNIVGCRNWVITLIAKTSALASWKQQQGRANCLSIVELVDRAAPIATDLTTGIVRIRDCPLTTSPPSLNQYTPFNVLPNFSASLLPTLIWAHAAQLYLSVVVSGWQPSNADVRANVAQIIKLLQAIPSYQLRALAWPVCVAGCLALESEESSFSALFSDQGKMYTAGALNDIRKILEQVWRTRATLHASTWDFASCFSILGSPVLLV